jgi:hypothetical protein
MRKVLALRVLVYMKLPRTVILSMWIQEIINLFGMDKAKPQELLLAAVPLLIIQVPLLAIAA